MKERKEYAVGSEPGEATREFDETWGDKFGLWSEKAHEIFEVVHDPETKLFSVFRKHRRIDHTVRRPIRREGRRPYSYGKDARPIVLTLLPGEVIDVRLKRRRNSHLISWHDLYAYVVRRDALAVVAQKRAE